MFLRYDVFSTSPETFIHGIIHIKVSKFFAAFTTFRKLLAIQQILVIKAQNIYQMKNIVYSYLLIKYIFESFVKKCKNLFLKIPFFKGCLEKCTTSVLKGLLWFKKEIQLEKILHNFDNTRLLSFRRRLICLSIIFVFLHWYQVSFNFV